MSGIFQKVVAKMKQEEKAKAKDDSSITKKLKPIVKPKPKAEDDSEVQKLLAWAKNNEPDEGWITNNKIKEIRLRKRYFEKNIDKRMSWIDYLSSKEKKGIIKIIIKIPKKENCSITINVDGKIWGNITYYGIVSESNISNYIENNHLTEILKTNTESSNVEIITEKQSLKRGLEVKANFNIITKEKFISKTVERRQIQYQKPSRHKAKPLIPDLHTQRKQETLKNVWSINIVLNNDENSTSIFYTCTGNPRKESLIKHIKEKIWPVKFAKKYGSAEKFHFDIIKN